jgi:Flp pilus assembly protein TadG
MWKLIRNNHGSSAVEFALAILPVMVFIIGLIQTGWMVWANNLLYMAVDAAARCGAIASQTPPCDPGGDMIKTAQTVFAPLHSASFTRNVTNCSNGQGVVGTYNVTLGFVVNLQLHAKSCYPNPL